MRATTSPVGRRCTWRLQGAVERLHGRELGGGKSRAREPNRQCGSALVGWCERRPETASRGRLDIDCPRAGPGIAHGCAINASVSARVNLVARRAPRGSGARRAFRARTPGPDQRAAANTGTREHAPFKANLERHTQHGDFEVRTAWRWSTPGANACYWATRSCIAAAIWPVRGDPYVVPKRSSRDVLQRASGLPQSREGAARRASHWTAAARP